MAVGHVASASSGSQASVATFNIGTLGTGARAGIVFVAIHNSATDIITGVTWNSVAMTPLYSATDTDTEPGVVKAYFLDNVTNGVITVSRTNNTVVTVGYAASISASGKCEAYQTITRVSSTQNTNANTSTTGTGASGEVAVDDGNPGTNSLRYACSYTGAATPVAAGTNSTNLQSLDSTALGSRFVRETNAGNGSRNVGFATGTTDDWALVAVAVREAAVTSAPTAGALTLTGDTPTVTATDNKLAEPTAASLVLAGATPTVTVATNTVVLPTAASLVLTGATPAVTAPALSQPTAAALTLTGATPAVTAPAISLPTAAALVLAGATPAVAATDHKTALPTAAALVLSGATPSVTAPFLALPDAASLLLTPATPDVIVGASDNKVALPSAASLLLSGAIPDVLAPVTVTPGPLGLTLTGDTPAVAATANILSEPSPAALLLAGAVPDIAGGFVTGGRSGGKAAVPPMPRMVVNDPDADEAYLLGGVL